MSDISNESLQDVLMLGVILTIFNLLSISTGKYFMKSLMISTQFPQSLSLDVSQHMSKTEKFAIGEDDNTYILNVYKTDLNAAQLQLHPDMFLDTARDCNVKLQVLHDVIDLLSGDQGKCLH